MAVVAKQATIIENARLFLQEVTEAVGAKPCRALFRLSGRPVQKAAEEVGKAWIVHKVTSLSQVGPIDAILVRCYTQPRRH